MVERQLSLISVSAPVLLPPSYCADQRLDRLHQHAAQMNKTVLEVLFGLRRAAQHAYATSQQHISR